MGEGDGPGTEFYDTNFVDAPDAVNRAIREAAFGEDIGQFSWTTADEHRRFQRRLAIDADSHVLEVASGSGGPALFLARSTGCRLTGIDIHDAGVATAIESAETLGLSDRASFLVHDAADPLPFDDGSFDAIISIDSMNHLYDRPAMFREWWRVLRPGGRLLYTDAVVVTGPLRRDEILARSTSMGEFVFTPYGADEGPLRAAGFTDIGIEDVTANIEAVSGAWHAARRQATPQLDEIEGTGANATFQGFLATVHLLAFERRLSRLAYTATRPTPNQ